MKTLVYSVYGFDKPYLEKASQDKHQLVFTEQSLNKDTAKLAKGFHAVSIFTSDDAASPVLKKLHACGVMYISLRSVGHNNVDLEKAKSLGMKVANVPAYSPYSVAEHATALLLALNRKLILGQNLMQIGDYRLDHLVGYDLHGKTIGIIGTGKIGRAFAKIMNGFGCKLLAYDLVENNELISQTNISYTTLENLCKKSDVISIHCPLNSTTKSMFNKTIFSMMKKGMVFINTSRGGIVKTFDLLEALNNGTIAAAGLDVYENEKTIFFHNYIGLQIKDDIFCKLRSHPNVLITGHQGFLTNEALQGIANTTIANLTDWEYNGISVNEVK